MTITLQDWWLDNRNGILVVKTSLKSSQTVGTSLNLW